MLVSSANKIGVNLSLINLGKSFIKRRKYAVLYHDQKLSFLVYNCSRSLKFNICDPDHKICVYVENVLFPQFFET